MYNHQGEDIDLKESPIDPTIVMDLLPLDLLHFKLSTINTDISMLESRSSKPIYDDCLSKDNHGIIFRIPPEIWMTLIFCYLPCCDLAQLMLTCRTFSNLITLDVPTQRRIENAKLNAPLYHFLKQPIPHIPYDLIPVFTEPTQIELLEIEEDLYQPGDKGFTMRSR